MWVRQDLQQNTVVTMVFLSFIPKNDILDAKSYPFHWFDQANMAVLWPKLSFFDTVTLKDGSLSYYNACSSFRGLYFEVYPQRVSIYLCIYLFPNVNLPLLNSLPALHSWLLFMCILYELLFFSWVRQNPGLMTFIGSIYCLWTLLLFPQIKYD